jgi:hypothetical protein
VVAISRSRVDSPGGRGATKVTEVIGRDAAREMKVGVTCWGVLVVCFFSGSIVSCSRVATWRGCCRAGGCTMVIVVLVS